MAVGVACDGITKGSSYEYAGRKYYYVNAAGNEWQLGKLPKELANEQPIVISID